VWPQAAAQGADGGDGALWSGEVRRDLRGSPQGTIRAKKLRGDEQSRGALTGNGEDRKRLEKIGVAAPVFRCGGKQLMGVVGGGGGGGRGIDASSERVGSGGL